MIVWLWVCFLKFLRLDPEVPEAADSCVLVWVKDDDEDEEEECELVAAFPELLRPWCADTCPLTSVCSPSSSRWRLLLDHLLFLHASVALGRRGRNVDRLSPLVSAALWSLSVIALGSWTLSLEGSDMKSCWALSVYSAFTQVFLRFFSGLQQNHWSRTKTISSSVWRILLPGRKRRRERRREE